MTTHYRAPFSNTHAACGQRTRNFENPFDCLKCLSAMRRVRRIPQQEVTHAPAAVPATDVNAGNEESKSSASQQSDVVTHAASTSNGVVFGTAAASIPGTCVRKWPHANAFRFAHYGLPDSRIVITKYPSPPPIMPAYN